MRLNEFEKRAGYWGGRKRNKNTIKNGGQSRSVSKDDPEQLNIQGMLAEIAFGKYTGTYFDTDVNPKKLPPHDCILPDGRRVDVKSTPYRNGKLTVPPGKQRPDGVDLYALMVGKNDTWRFAGMATADELWNDDNLGQLKKDGPVSHILGQKDLAPLVIYGKIYPIEDEEWTI